MASSQDALDHLVRANGHSDVHSTKHALVQEPLELGGHLKKYKSFKSTPIIGTEYPDANLAEWLTASNSDRLIRDLAITSNIPPITLSTDISLTVAVSRRGVVFFRAQRDLTDVLQKELAHRLGKLTGKPESSYLHIHPLSNFNDDKDLHINVITTDKAAAPAEDLWKNRPADIRNAWHTDAGYEPNPPDYSVLKLTKMPKCGGGKLKPDSPYIYHLLTLQIRFGHRRARHTTRSVLLTGAFSKA